MALESVVCGQCGAPFTYERKAAARKYCSERCKANANGNPYRGRVRRCACGSTEVARTGWPVCPDCRLDGRDRKGYNRRRRLELYGLTQERFDEILTEQRGRCPCCGTDDPGPRGWFVDHDHDCCPGLGSCGECVRGLVCCDCNLMLGYAKDSTETLERARKYLHVNAAKRGARLEVVK